MEGTTDSLGAYGVCFQAPSTDPSSPAASVVVGLGNEIAGDDGVGIQVARNLGRLLEHTPTVDVVALPWAGLALLDVLRGHDRAAIVDCLTTGDRPPGTLVRLDEQGLAGSVRLNSFHDIAFPTAMDLGRRMGWDLPSQVAIWGVEADRVDEFHEGLSPAVAAAVEPLIREVLGYLGIQQDLVEPTGVTR
jgi:hydrogenase maturation protease